MYLNLASSKNRNKGRIFIGVLIIFLISALGIRQPETVYGAEREKTERAFVGVPVLMYHHLTQEDGDAKGVTITQDRFRADMKYLERNDYTPLLPTDLSAIAAGEQAMPQRPIIITFDDGYESNYRLGFPVLKETGMKATIFVITEAMNTQRQGQIPKLTWVQMKEMYDSGFVDIQTHSHDLHNSENQGEFKRFDINGIQRTSTENQTQYDSRVGSDFENSIHLIEKNVGNDVMAISYPFGVFEPWSLRLLEELGIEFGFIIGNTTGDFFNKPYEITRYNVNMNKGLWQLLEKIEGMNQEPYA